MPFFLIASLIIAGLSIIFSIQNTDEVAIQFLFWHFESPLVLILLLTLLAGVVIGILIAIPALFRSKKKALMHKREAKEAQRQAEEARKINMQLESEVMKKDKESSQEEE